MVYAPNHIYVVASTPELYCFTMSSCFSKTMQQLTPQSISMPSINVISRNLILTTMNSTKILGPPNQEKPEQH